MPIWGRIAALLVAVVLVLPAAAGAQAPAPTQSVPTQEPGSTRPPVDLGNGAGNGANSSPSSESEQGELPNTGSDARLLFLTGLALTLLGVGLRLRTADADVY